MLRRVPALAHIAVQAVGQRLQPFPAADAARQTLDFRVVGIRLAVAQVVHDAAAEQKGRLWHDAQPAAPGLQVEGANVLPVDANPAALEFVEARDEAGNGAFAGAGVPHESHVLAGLNLQVEVAQERLAFRVTEGYFLEGDVSPWLADGPVIMLDDSVLRIDERERRAPPRSGLAGTGSRRRPCW